MEYFHPVLWRWFTEAFAAPTNAQLSAWPPIAQGRNTLLLAPTGSGKTLAAFLVSINRIMFGPARALQPAAPVAAKVQQASKRGVPRAARSTVRNTVRTLYISPLKALGVDIERNLRSPLAGVCAVAQREQTPHHVPTVGVRSGDTPQAERMRLRREPPDILITTPESLYLMLTSRARDTLRYVETVIIDEIHSLVATKRGAHLFLSLERLELLRRQSHVTSPLQRIGLSATQRPLDEVARLLGGAEWPTGEDAAACASPIPRPVEIVEAGRSKQLNLRIEVPIADMRRPAESGVAKTGPTADDQDDEGSEELDVGESGPAAGPSVPSLWPEIHPRLIELIRQQRSTMIFVNSRRLAERMALAINEMAEEELALAHHGSVARDARLAMEDRLKRGELPAIVATSSLELGIDMGAVDLVIQIESPPSIAAGIQRIGRAGHQVGAPSSGVIFPKYRGDLLVCSAAAARMTNGEVESTHYPRNPLDVLAQQIVAMVALGTQSADTLFQTVRCAANFHDLTRKTFDGVLDFLSGRYPSAAFSQLSPRVTWDRLTGMIAPRDGAQRLAVSNAGTIPDRGLYGVFLLDDTGKGSRVGELDEEMVHELHIGDVFQLGASSWRTLEITKDRVVVSPAPGVPARMPFWRGEGPGRPLEFGQAVGQLTRELVKMKRDHAEELLVTKHALSAGAARNLVEYLHEQRESTGEVPSDRTIVVEQFLDDLGDWRVILLTPFGARVHAPWATAVRASLQRYCGGEVDAMWSDDGIVFRVPEGAAPPPEDAFFPASENIREMIISELGGAAVFAARFRENAARALLLPRNQPGRRQPLWFQRRRAADLLAAVQKFPDFPILLETYRECLRDVFDVQGLESILRDVERRVIRVVHVQTSSASPFAASLMFSYVGQFIYEGDTPLAERRAATLALDHVQLRELLGDAELRELLDRDAVDEVAREAGRRDTKFSVRSPDSLHHLLLTLGDLSTEEISLRVADDPAQQTLLRQWLDELQSARRIVLIRIVGQDRWIAAEDAARYRDALGIVPPQGLPFAFLEPVEHPLKDLITRYARTHGPFREADILARLGLGTFVVRQTLMELAADGRVVEGEFVPGERGLEWCDVEILRRIKRKSLAKLREQIEPVEPLALARFVAHWQSVTRPRRGLDGLLDVIQQLQGLPLPASVLESEVLDTRVQDYQPADFDELCAAGEIVWQGLGSLGTNDGRVALYLTDHFPLLAPAPTEVDHPLAEEIRQTLRRRGALFFEQLARSLGEFPPDVLKVVWQMVWAGELTNDTFYPMRRYFAPSGHKTRASERPRFRSRLAVRTTMSEGRWALLHETEDYPVPSPTERQAAIARQVLERYGLITRELVSSEGIPGNFAGLYPIFRAMEEAGQIRRGYFVAGLGAAQFALPGAEDRLRSIAREVAEADSVVQVLSACDPANPYGTMLRWPATRESATKPSRTAGARVLLSDGRLLAYINRNGDQWTTFLDENDTDFELGIRRLVGAMVDFHAPDPIYVTLVDGVPPGESILADALRKASFSASPGGYLRHRKQ
jgi:ATP-dependent Lhr-like helicase